MHGLVHDVRHPFRSLRGTPTITLGALICLGLGMGATTAVFSVVDRVVFHPLAYPQADRLLSVMERNQKKGFPSFVVSIANFRDWQAQATSFSALGAFTQTTYTLTGAEDAERLPVGKASAGFFEALGVAPLLGRTFRSDDDSKPVALITEEWWTQQFARDANILGRSIVLDDTPVIVIGVMPRGFTEPDHQRYVQSAFVSVAGEPDTDLARSPVVQYRAVSPNYFGVMSVPLRNGRAFADTDGERAPVVAIVNEALRDRLKLPNLLGRQVSLIVWNTTGSLHGDVRRLATIVGVVGDTQESFSRGPMVYVPFVQHSMPFLTVILSPRGTGAALTGSLRARLRDVDPHQPSEKVQTYDQLLGRGVAEPRFYATVLGVFAVIGLVLAAVGVYTVVSTVVAQRTREIGIRRALGAEDRQVIRLMLRDGFVLCASGFVLGSMGALASTRALKSIIVNTRPYDPLTIGAAMFVFGGLTVIAVYVPARRASHVDPISALRSE